jgi:hypothetical protein
VSLEFILLFSPDVRGAVAGWGDDLFWSEWTFMVLFVPLLGTLVKWTTPLSSAYW